MRKAARSACLVAALGALCAPSVAAAQSGNPPPASRFQKVTLDARPGEAMSLAVLPDRRVLYTARTGQVRIHNPRTGLDRLAAEVPVYQHDEEGLQGIALDPNFEDNRWVYLYYSPPLDTPVDDPSTVAVNEGDAPFEGTEADFAPFKGALRLSRFKLVRSELDLVDRAAHHRRPVRPRHLLPRRRPDRLRRPGQPLPVDRRRHEPVLLGRLRAAGRSAGQQPRLRLAPYRGQHQRPAGEAAAHPGRPERRLQRAEGQPVPGVTGHRGQDPSGDLRDGLAQSLPLRGQPEQRRRLHGRLLARRV